MTFLLFKRECSREGCDSWQRLMNSTVENHWIDAVFNHPTQTYVEAFCTIDCMMHWAAAHSVPTETIEAN